MSIAFVDLKAQYRALEKDIRAAIDGVLEHGRFIMGPEIGELEAALQDYTGASHAITCSSGTDALLMALMAYDIGPGDAVFTTPFTFIATAEVITLLGATPVFVDVDPRTFNIDPMRLEEVIRHTAHNTELKLRGIITVDLFGLPADYPEINRIAGQHEMFVLQDAAQSLGSTVTGKGVGTVTDIAATSFFPAKPLGCYGDGGAVFTQDEARAEKLRSIRIHGKGRDKYDNVQTGLNARLDTLQAGILLAKLSAFPEELATRQKIADHYTSLLSVLVETPHIPDGWTSAWAQYSILTEERETIQQALKGSGIPSMVYYPKPLHLQTAFAYLGHRQGDFPVSESLSNKILSLPMHPYLTEDDVTQICSVIVLSLN